MAYFSQQLINAITLGAIYGLIAIGYTMVYGIIGMINFAHGEVFMIGAFISLIGFMICSHARHRLGAGRHPAGAADGHGLHRRLRLGDRANGLSSVARLVPAGAADLGHRRVDRAAELRAARAGRAAQARRAGRVGRLQPVQRRRLRCARHLAADHHRRGDGGADGGLHLADRVARRSAASSAPASRT